MYCPQSRRSALVNSATRRSVSGSRVASGATRRSCKIWLTRSEGTVRKDADSPMSVLSISATVEPSQLSDGLPDAFGKGKIAREISGAVGGGMDADNVVNFPRRRKAAMEIAKTAAASKCQ